MAAHFAGLSAHAFQCAVPVSRPIFKAVHLCQVPLSCFASAYVGVTCEAELCSHKAEIGQKLHSALTGMQCWTAGCDYWCCVLSIVILGLQAGAWRVLGR